jgi:ABC-type multidrug transport system ATPase subunit
VLSNRLRQRGVNSIVDQRQLTATWMAAAVRDNGELASPRASARFLAQIADATGAWCAAEEAVERARTRHRLAIAALCALALYVVALSHGVDLLRGVPTHAVLSESLLGALLLGSCLPAAYAFAAHLESISVANSELSRLALGLTERTPGKEIRLERRPLTLRATGVSTRHDHSLALDLGDLQISLQHPVAIAGPNGSGKTTLATLLSGVRTPSAGSMTLDDIPANDVSRDDVAFVPQDPVLIESLSILENLRLVAADCDRAESEALLKSLGLDTSLDKPAGSLSRGEQRRIATARALLKRPKLLVLDEPDAWLDAEGRRCLLQTLKAIAHEVSILVVSHRPDVLVQFETVVVLNEHHHVEAVDHPRQLRRDSPAFRALLGAEQPDTPALDAETRH